MGGECPPGGEGPGTERGGAASRGGGGLLGDTQPTMLVMTGDKGGGDRPPADPPERTLLQSSGMELSSMSATPSLEPPVSHSLRPPLRVLPKSLSRIRRAAVLPRLSRRTRTVGARAAWAAAGGRSRQERVAGGRAGRASVGGAVVRRGQAVVTECRSPISRCAHPHRDTHTRNTNTTFNKMCKRNMRVRGHVCVRV